MTDKIVKYLDAFIEQFREEENNLKDTEKPFFRGYIDLSEPCQIDVFLLNGQIKFQLLLISHDSDSKDKEVIINGPYEPKDFLEKLEKYVKNDKKWIKALPEAAPIKNLDGSRISYGDIILGALANTFKNMNNLLFANIKSNELYPVPVMFVNVAAEELFGDIELFDYNKFLMEKINLAKQLAQIAANSESNKVVTTLPAPVSGSKGGSVVFSGTNIPTNATGYGVMFYPPVWIDKRPKQSLAEEVMHSPIFRKKAFDIDFMDKKLIFTQDGFIGLECRSVQEATMIFNVIFGIAHLAGYFCFAVNEDDIAQITINKIKYEIGSIAMQGHSERMQLMNIQNFNYNRRWKVIKKDAIIPIVDLANKIINDQLKVNQIIFLLEGYTYLVNSEYSQSFIMDWLIVEKYFANKWDELLKEKQITGKRKEDFRDVDKWDSYHKLELLNFTGNISNETYDLLRDLNTKRNHLVHKGEPINQDDADKLYKFASNLIRESLRIEIAT